jgi:pimeloyl-ACP methyl ester carboxylesterase
MKRWVNPLLLGLSVVLLPSFVSAEITSPYIVDEKEQVIFGDSDTLTFEGKDYYGFQNYKQEYVNGYARFSFSYTHNSCCYSSYPLRIYMTDSDPRNSTSTQVMYDQEIYSLKTYWAGFGDPTDIYFFEIQFDETGFTKTVKRRGGEVVVDEHVDVADQRRSNFAAIANRYPRYNPNLNEYSLSLTPIKVSTLPVEEKINPVIIIPGIMGSSKKGDVWLIDPILHTYDDLIATLEANGYQREKNLFTFPYEWRDSNVETAKLLKTKIADVKEKCAAANLSDTNCSKVDLVAHSMGGLVARQYVQSNDYQNDVDQLIFLGTPHRGAPEAYLMWEGGATNKDIKSNLTYLFFTFESLKKGYLDLFNYIHNRPILSVKELLPIYDYLKDKESGILRTYPNNYPENYFLENLNSVDWVSELKSKGVKMNNLVNSEQQTLSILRVVQEDNGKFWVHGIPDGFKGSTQDRGLEKGYGDGTVPVYSFSIGGVDNYDLYNTNHRDLPSKSSRMVFELLTQEDDFQEILPTNINTMALIQLQSPVDMVITSPDGKKLGKDFTTGQEFNEIPGAFYSGYDTHEEYLTIPNPLPGAYKIELIGTDNGGKYGVVSSVVSDTSATSTTITGVTNPNQITQINVSISDADKPVVVEKQVTPELLIQDIKNAYTLGWIKDKKTRDSLVSQVEAAIKFNKKIEKVKERHPDGTTHIRNIERFSVKINKILIKLFERELEILLKNKKITKEAYDLIVGDLKVIVNQY